jgi:hypothetical protein
MSGRIPFDHTGFMKIPFPFTGKTKKAGLPVIRQPGCPFIVAQDPRLSAHRLLGVRLLLIEVTISKLSQLYDQWPRSLKYLPPTIIASAFLDSLRFTPRT